MTTFATALGLTGVSLSRLKAEPSPPEFCSWASDYLFMIGREMDRPHSSGVKAVFLAFVVVAAQGFSAHGGTKASHQESRGDAEHPHQRVTKLVYRGMGAIPPPPEPCVYHWDLELFGMTRHDITVGKNSKSTLAAKSVPNEINICASRSDAGEWLPVVMVGTGTPTDYRYRWHRGAGW